MKGSIGSTRARWGAALVVALGASACGGGDGGGSAGGDLPECPLDALEEAGGVVEVEFWHAMTSANETALQQLTEQFNTSQDQVKVNLVNNSSYTDNWTKYRGALQTDELPDLLQNQEIYLQQSIDSQSMVPAQSCMEADDDFDADDYVARALSYYEVEDVQWALPFNVSNPVLLYNRNAFVAAGLDPDDPPATLDDLRAAAQAIKDVGYPAGMAIKIDGGHVEQLLALQGQTLVDNGNGREGRATAANFDSEVGEETFAFLADMVADGLAITNPREGAGQYDNLFRVGSGEVGMTIDSSGTLGTIVETLSSGQFADVDPAVAPLPGRTEDGGVLVGGAGLYITARDAAKQAAAWEYMKFLTSPESQATWSAATGFLPVRMSATEEPAVQQRWSEIPGFRVAYDQLLEGAENDATAGPVIGDYYEVRLAIEGAENRMFLEGQSPADAVAGAVADSDAAIQDYNDRVST